MPAHNKAILADIFNLKLDPKKCHAETNKSGCLVDKSAKSKLEPVQKVASSVVASVTNHISLNEELTITAEIKNGLQFAPATEVTKTSELLENAPYVLPTVLEAIESVKTIAAIEVVEAAAAVETVKVIETVEAVETTAAVEVVNSITPKQKKQDKTSRLINNKK